VKWYAGSDHAGASLRRRLVEVLRGLDDEVVDLGTDGEASVDYPDFAVEVGRRVAGDGGSFGLLVCGTGIGIAMAANKVPGVRAAVVTDPFTARATRAHNDANVVAFGERVVGAGVAEEALRVFRDTPFEGGRHQRRVDKMMSLDGGRAGPGEKES
jgi:ribose 5-phosphate isomerase B